MRWLLLKDLRILRRSPLLVALLVLYPIVVAVLIGFAISRGPDKPEVAFYNALPSSENSLQLGGTRVDLSSQAGQLFGAIKPIKVHSREAAIKKVRDGDALGALIIPADLTRNLQTGLQPGTVDVYYNAEDPAKRRLVENTIKSEVQTANGALTKLIGREALKLLEQLRFGNVDPDVDLATARKSDAQCEVVGDAERQQARRLTAQDLAPRLDHLALDTTAGDRPGELAALGDRELRADRPRRGSPGRDDARERHALTSSAPAVKVGPQLPHGAIVVSAGRPQPLWQSQICSPSLRRSRLRPQRAHVGGRIFAATRSPRISVAQSTT